MIWVLLTHETIMGQDVYHAYRFGEEVEAAYEAGEKLEKAARRAGSDLQFAVTRMEDRPKWS